MIVDDGSLIPLTQQALATEPARHRPYPKVQIIRQRNAGPASARNHGVHAAHGELVAFIDDDCLPDPHWLSQLVQSWRLSPEALVGGCTINGLQKQIFSETSQLIVSLVYDFFNRDPAKAYFLASNNILCTKRQFQEIGGFSADFPRAGAEDRDFCDRWRIRGWPIIWNRQAEIKHYHKQDLRQFVDLHIRYGRGAYIYHWKRTQRASGELVDEMGFHQALPSLVSGYARRGKWSKIYALQILACLAIWQLANAIGFMLECCTTSYRRLARMGWTKRTHHRA